MSELKLLLEFDVQCLNCAPSGVRVIVCAKLVSMTEVEISDPFANLSKQNNFDRTLSIQDPVQRKSL